MTRNLAVDAYRGFVMLLMMAEVLRLSKWPEWFPGNPVAGWLAFHQSHVPWAGCSLHDMIQPSFSFLVGVAMPFSLASRRNKGASEGELLRHAFLRGLVLAAMGIFLRSTHATQTNFTFEDTLTQIGLGYPLLHLLSFLSERKQWIALGVILFGYWLAWALYPLPGQAFGEHWEKANNLGVWFDRWFLNLFPRPKPFDANRGGYVTLSFIPTLGTMLLGLIAGQWLRQLREFSLYLRTAGLLLALGLAAHFGGICPIVKRIWTPAWTLFSGGICLLFLSGFRYVMEVRGWTRWAYPLVVVGMNSIAAYWIAHVSEGFIDSSWRIHLGWLLEPKVVQPLLVLATEWWILRWMYERKLFLKV